MVHLKILLRFTFLIIWVVFGFLVLFLMSPLRTSNIKKKVINYWSKILLSLIGLRVICKGKKNELPAYPFIVVSNHISWVDIFVLLSVLPVSFIAKKEIKKWFFLGGLVEMAGTIFIDRNRRKSIKEVSEKVTQKSLDLKKSYAFFPEGKTSPGKTIQKFHSGLFSLFLDNEKLTLLPVLIKYKKDDVFTEACAYVGDMTLLQSVVRIIKNSNLSAELQIMPASAIKNTGDGTPSEGRKYLASQIRIKMLELYHQ
ncbi:1-acyl-sn-glycerol-3-phosphate acyltransferase [Betaproteobacteria bacterium]|nr:1-acyl-sn-glycerol-3-phosphate acyltransferase [Betaproteobacteria bacterium]